MRQGASISDFRRRQRMFGLARGCSLRLFDMLRHRIEQVHLISAGSEPTGIGSGASSGIDDSGRSGRQVAENQFLRAGLFELKPSGAETRGFVGVAVVTNNLLDGIVVTHEPYRSFEFALVSPRQPGGVERDSPTAWRYVAPRPSTLLGCAAWFERLPD